MSEEMKSLHLRAGLLGSGGKNNVSSKAYGAIGNRLREEYGFLREFISEIKDGQMTSDRIVWRTGLYAKAAISTRSRAELIDRQNQGIVYAKRFLEPGANHCPSCPNYERRQWTPIEEIVPVGYLCECRRNCRCDIEYFLGNVSTLERSLGANIA